MATATKRVSVKELLDNSPATSFQFGLYTLCFLVVFFDGFDVALIGVTLPKIGQFLHAAPGALGLAIGASLAGPLVGALVLGMLADRFGRKNMLILSTVIYGAFALVTTATSSIGELALYRFLTGVGLGGAIPNALAYGCEFAPTHKRASFTTLMYAGMPVGSIPVGFLAAWLLPNYGWQILYWVCGIPSLVLAVILALYLPESLGFLVRRGGDIAKIEKIATKISPSFSARDTELYSTEAKLPGVPVKHLFLEGRAFTTIAIWVLFFLTFYLAYIMLAWAPALLRKSGATVQQASYAFAFIGIGSFLATVTIGRLIDRFNRYIVVAIGFVLAFLSLAIFGILASSPFLVVAVTAFVCGLFVFGTNSGCLAIGTISYPVSIRGSALGWAYAIGKTGSMLAPIVVGAAMGWNWSVARICVVNGLAGLVGAVVLMILKWHTVRQTAKSAEIAAVSAAAHS